MNMRCVAIIPARGGSKGIRNKNLKYLNGKPLIYYAIQAAKKALSVDRVVVSTDSKKIKDTALHFGADVPFLRPASLSTDVTPMHPVIKHAVNFLEHQGERFDIICVLQPTSPLRTADDIDAAFNAFINVKADSLVSVCEAEHSPYWMRVIRNGKIFPFVHSRDYLRRQDLPKVYRLNGAVYLTKRDILMKRKQFLGRDIVPFIMPTELSVDIDTDLDFQLAEMILRKKR